MVLKINIKLIELVRKKLLGVIGIEENHLNSIWRFTEEVILSWDKNDYLKVSKQGGNNMYKDPLMGENILRNFGKLSWEDR